MRRAQLIAYRVQAGQLVRHYATQFHADQMARALRASLAGTSVTVETVRLPDDALTRLTLGGA